jgi:hypothetical protein
MRMRMRMTMSKRKVKIGDIVCITFLDHAFFESESNKAPLEFHVYGKLIHEDKDQYLLATWISPLGVDNNTDCYGIIKRAVKGIKVLR